MLTGDLVRVRTEGANVRPAYVDPANPVLLDRAEQLLQLYRDALEQHWPRERLVEEARLIEGFSTDHKLTRGVAKVLEDRCEFATVSPVEPAELRQQVFALAASRGPLAREANVLGRPTAMDLLREVAEPLGVTAEALSLALYADRADQQVLTSAELPTPRALLERYNVGLVQALLLRARSVTLTLDHPDPKRVRQLLRHLRFHELLFRVGASEADGDAEGTLTLTVDGPESLLRLTTRYGLQLALFFPAVLLQPGTWRLEAEVLRGRRNLKKKLVVDSAAGLVGHYRDVGAWRSKAEVAFEERFGAEREGWTLHPGAAIDRGAQSMLAPDFTFKKQRIARGRVTEEHVGHLQFVGVWRKARLSELVAQAGPGFLLAAAAKLSADKAAAVPPGVILYRDYLSPDAVVEQLEKLSRARTKAPPTKNSR